MRDVITGEEISYKKFNNKYVVRVEPHRAILEPDYFIKMIEIAEQEREQEIEKLRTAKSQMRKANTKKKMSGTNYRNFLMKNT